MIIWAVRGLEIHGEPSSILRDLFAVLGLLACPRPVLALLFVSLRFVSENVGHES